MINSYGALQKHRSEANEQAKSSQMPFNFSDRKSTTTRSNPISVMKKKYVPPHRQSAVAENGKTVLWNKKLKNLNVMNKKVQEEIKALEYQIKSLK